MYHIFLDFEMTCWSRRDKIMGRKIPEIIEIGAVKLDDNFQMIDSFSVYVKPEYTSVLSRKCEKLTGIRTSDLSDAPTLAEALIEFEDWMGSEDVKIYSWAMDDKIQLMRECFDKELYDTLPACYRRWGDFQQIFKRVYGFSKRLSLIKAIEMMGLEFDGQQHKAVYDALNGARLLMLMKDKKTHRKQKERLKSIYNCNQPLTSTLGELLGEKLSTLSFAS